MMRFTKGVSKTMSLIALVLIFNFPFNNTVLSQKLDYGIEIGLGSFNQNWQFEGLPFSGWKKDRLGLTCNLFGELNHSKMFSTKLELGYLRKGYINDLIFENQDGSTVVTDSYKFGYNTITMGIGEKITIMNSKLKPFVIVGFNFQFIPKNEIDDQSLLVMEKTGNVLIFGGPLDPLGWNNITFNGNVGLGLIYNDLIFVTFKYNHSLTNLLSKNYITVSDRYFGCCVGMNINKLF